MWSILRTPVEVVYTLGTAFDGIVYAVYTAAILTVGLVVWYGIFWLVEYLVFRKERGSTYVLKESNGREKVWMERPSRSCGNIGHLVIQTLFYGGLVIIVWLASASAGFNPWTSAAASLGLSIIATYALATPLSLLGTGYFIHLSNAISVGEFYEFYGMGDQWEGRVIAIYSMWVEMVRFNSEKDKMTGELIYMPISTFLSTPRKRVWKKECVAEEQCGIRSADTIPIEVKGNRMQMANVPPRAVTNRYAESFV